MAITADYLDYSTARTWDQGQSSTCVSHAFFTLLAEHIQQSTGKIVEFDFDKYHDEAEEYKKENGGHRVVALCKIAKDKGFKTKTGELVKIGSYRRYAAYRNFQWLCRIIQTAGPFLLSLYLYKGHSLNPSSDIITTPKGERKGTSHMVMIRGFDFPSEWLRIQNSWYSKDEDNIKWLPHPALVEMCQYMYYVSDVTIK